MSKVILIGILISVIIIPLGNSFSQLSKNQTSEVVVVDGPEAKANLDRFDKLDFEAWNKNNWTLYKEIHSPDVLVVDFDGKVTNGIDQHLKWSN